MSSSEKTPFWLSIKNKLIKLQYRELEEGNQWASLKNKLINVVLGLLAALPFFGLCWIVVDQLIPVVAGSNLHFGAIWAAPQMIQDSKGAFNHCALEEVFSQRLRLLEATCVVLGCLYIGPRLRQRIVSGRRTHWSYYMYRMIFAFLFYLAVVASLVANQSVSYGQPVQKPWCEIPF